MRLASPRARLSPPSLYSYCFTLRYKLRGGEYLESHTYFYPLSRKDRPLITPDEEAASDLSVCALHKCTKKSSAPRRTSPSFSLRRRSPHTTTHTITSLRIFAQRRFPGVPGHTEAMRTGAAGFSVPRQRDPTFPQKLTPDFFQGWEKKQHLNGIYG